MCYLSGTVIGCDWLDVPTSNVGHTIDSYEDLLPVKLIGGGANLGFFRRVVDGCGHGGGKAFG